MFSGGGEFPESPQRALPAYARMIPRRLTMRSGPEAPAPLPLRSLGHSPMNAAVMPSHRASISAEPRPAPSSTSPMASKSSCGRGGATVC